MREGLFASSEKDELNESLFQMFCQAHTKFNQICIFLSMRNPKDTTDLVELRVWLNISFETSSLSSHLSLRKRMNPLSLLEEHHAQSILQWICKAHLSTCLDPICSRSAHRSMGNVEFRRVLRVVGCWGWETHQSKAHCTYFQFCLDWREK